LRIQSFIHNESIRLPQFFKGAAEVCSSKSSIKGISLCGPAVCANPMDFKLCVKESKRPSTVVHQLSKYHF
jgi:hypothetical protein